MKYKVTVDGTAYIVEVEDLGISAAPVPRPVVFAPVPAAEPAPVAEPVEAPAPVAKPAPTTPASAPIPSGGISITAPMPGKILKIAVSVGQTVIDGDVVIVLEAMKMENEIFATTNGKIIDIRVNSGDTVNVGDVLIVIG